MARGVAAFKVGKLYVVEWADHYDETKSWMRSDEISHDKEVIMTTVGWCLGSGRLYVTLAGTKELTDDDPLYSQVFKCIKTDIRKATLIKE